MIDPTGGGMALDIQELALNSRTLKYTVAMITILPILCVYPFMQRYFVKGIMMGAVKG